jgi:hypothetical protein
MNLSATEFASVRSLGLYITEKCDGCGKLLNQTVRYTITGKPEIYCSTACRDTAFFGDLHEVKKRATPGKCAHCGGSLEGKKSDSIFCKDACRKAHFRKVQRMTAREGEKTRTPTQSDQRVGSLKTGGLGVVLPEGPNPSETPLARVPQNLRCRSKWGRQPRGAEK